MTDAVNSPPHYTTGGIEAIDYIRAKLGPQGFRAYCLGNVLKYVIRYAHKDGEQDLAKAAVYLDWARAKPEAPAELSIHEIADAIKTAPVDPRVSSWVMGAPFDDEEPPLRSVMGDKL